MDNFQPILRTFWTVLGQCQVSTELFSLRGEIPGYSHSQVAEIYLSRLLIKGERKGEKKRGEIHLSRLLVKGEIQQYIGTLLVKGESNTLTYNPVVWVAHQYNSSGKGEKGTGIPSHASGVGRDPHPVGHQPGHQGEWAVVKETSHIQGKQPMHQGCMVIT